MSIKIIKILLTLFSATSFAATSIQFNQIGYEKAGPKTAIFQIDGNSGSADSFTVFDKSNNSKFKGKAKAAVDGWNNKKYQILDFSQLESEGDYYIECGGAKSTQFTITDRILFEKTASSVVSFFNKMRSTDNDHAVPFFSDSNKTHDVYGGWYDATGDKGKYLSHLSYANYFNPQQIPFVVWSLLKSYELNSTRFSSMTPNIVSEAAWGADYLLRVLDPNGYFYITIFDGWGFQSRQICAWSNEEGNKSADHQAALREGGGMSIAALAKIARTGIHGDSSTSQYLAAAERAYKHLKEKNKDYVDDGKENIIDDYCGLLAAVELYLTTKSDNYLSDAESRARNLIKRNSTEGWFYSDDGSRPFNHASDEGLPIVALIEFLSTKSTLSDSVKTVIKNAVAWYVKNSMQESNPFNYPRQKVLSVSSSPNANIALNKTAKASQSESSPYNGPAAQAFDGDKNTRWASGSPYLDSSWIQIDLGNSYQISRVVLNWETACGKEYEIRTSLNGEDWTVAATVKNGSPGIKEISFSPVNGRYVRMQGISRSTSYGYSLFEFEVYGGTAEKGKIVEQYFIPHSNETGYWWQGENARLSSIATAMLMAAQIKDLLDQQVNTDAKRVAISSLDWILGKNPFGVCMLYGFGQTTYPSYESKNGFDNVIGGVCNGITAGVTNEEEVAWMPYSAGLDFWKNWRWIEQWLPHDAWYLLAIAQQSNLIDNPYSVKWKKNSLNRLSKVQIKVKNNSLSIKIPNAIKSDECRVEVVDLKGRTIQADYSFIAGNEITLKLRHFASGIYFVKVHENTEWQKFSVEF